MLNTTQLEKQLEIETLAVSLTALAESVNSAILAGDFDAAQRKSKMILILSSRLKKARVDLL